MSNVFERIPVWVFPLFLALLALGLMQRRDRVVAPGVVLGVGLAMAALSLAGVAGTLGARPASLAAWAAGVALALGAGWWVWPMRAVACRRAGQRVRVQVPGSWTPLLLMMGIFGLRFALGVAAGMGAPVRPGTAAATAVALLLGLLGGTFAARALAVGRALRAPAPVLSGPS